MNNKGFAISGILYLSLILFLLFLMLTLSQFMGSAFIIGKSNQDLIDGTKLHAFQVRERELIEDGKCKWVENDKLVKINSRYGTMYWPYNFYKDTSNFKIEDFHDSDTITFNKISVKYTQKSNNEKIDDKDYYGILTVTDSLNNSVEENVYLYKELYDDGSFECNN